MNAKKQAKQAARNEQIQQRALALIEQASIYLHGQLQADIDAAEAAGNDAYQQNMPQPSAAWPHSAAPTSPATSPAQQLLLDASQVIGQRGQERDSGQERSMAAAVKAFNAIEGAALSERQGWAFMQTLKLVRAASTARNGRYNPDDYLDGAAYAALGAEAAAYAHACQEGPAA